MLPYSHIGRLLDSCLGTIRIDSEIQAGSFGEVFRGNLIAYPEHALSTQFLNSTTTTITKKFPLELPPAQPFSNPIDTSFAVKILYKKNLNAQQLEIQKREVELHSKVSDHPNIVTLHEVLEDEHHLYLILDFWNEGDLFDALVGGSCLSSPYERLALFLQIVRAVEYCHQHKVYHRDLKPENILLRMGFNGWEAALSDFGLATDEVESAELGCGSPRYMSPEAMNGVLLSSPSSPPSSRSSIAYPASPDSLFGSWGDTVVEDSFEFKGSKSTYSTSSDDVWALGVILVNVLTNKNPWTAPKLTDDLFRDWFMESKKETTQKSFFTCHLGLSVAVGELLKDVFQMDPRDRIGAKEFGKRVELLLENESDLLLE